MHLHTYLPSLLLLPLALVQADTNSTIAALEAQISPCTQQCATTEITKYGLCAVTDFPCQCHHFSDLKALVGPCLQNNSTCSPAEIQSKSIGHYFTPICCSILIALQRSC